MFSARRTSQWTSLRGAGYPGQMAPIAVIACVVIIIIIISIIIIIIPRLTSKIVLYMEISEISFFIWKTWWQFEGQILKIHQHIIFWKLIIFENLSFLDFVCVSFTCVYDALCCGAVLYPGMPWKLPGMWLVYGAAKNIPTGFTDFNAFWTSYTNHLAIKKY